MSGRSKTLSVAIILILLISAVGVVLYSQNHTSDRSNASSAQPTVQAPYTTNISPTGTQVNALAVSGWAQNNVTQTNSLLTVTTPPGINWFYFTNTSINYIVNDTLSLDTIVNAHALNDTTVPEIAHIHLDNNLPFRKTPNNKLPDELIITRNATNKLFVSIADFTHNATSPKTDIIKETDNISFPDSGHIIIKLTGINSPQEVVTIFDGDTNSQLATANLPFTIFSNKNIFLALSVQNALTDLTRSIMNITKLDVTTDNE